MLLAVDILSEIAHVLGFSVLDTVTPLTSWPDASWDDFYFLQTILKQGGASKMITMMLMNSYLY